MFPQSMSEFKYACPVCGQHMKCDSSQAGSVMECPTCFQKITVPQAPATDEQKFIITGTKKSERPVRVIPEGSSNPVSAAKGFPGALVVIIIFILIGAAVAFVYRGTIFKSRGAGEIWTLDLDGVAIPDAPAAGKVHGRFFTAQTAHLNSDGLTLRTANLPPDAGVTIFLRPNPIESVFGKTIVVNTNDLSAPLVNLRWKNDQGGEADQAEKGGYALRIEFGQPDGDHLPGKIYLCAPDEMKSYIVGSFNAEIVKPK
jgi:DNA-directed RNA polymerase subunit RPC12/RpoP